MKVFGTILLVSAGLLNRAGYAEIHPTPLPFSKERGEDAKPVGATTNDLVVTTELINRLVAEARTNNPSLKAADSRVRSATANVGSVRTWEDPMATFGGEVFSPSGMDPGQMGNLAYGVEQKLPLWGRPKLNRTVAEADLSVRRADVDYRFQQLRRDLTRALLLTALAERVVEIGEQDLAWVEATAKATENKYRAGQAVVADTLEIQNEVAKRNDTLRTDRRRLGHEHIALNRLLNREVNSPWPVLKLPEVAPVVPFSEKLVTLALASEPRLKVMEQEIKQAETAAKLARNLRLPDVSFGVQGRQFSDDGGFRSGMFGLGVSLPWGNAGKYRKDYEREKERQKAAEQEREDQALMLREQLHHFTVEIEAFRREALLQRDEILTRATQALSSRLADWETGRGTFRDVLVVRRLLLESQIAAARAIAEQRQAVAELLLWSGVENAEALAPLTNEPSITPEHEKH